MVADFALVRLCTNSSSNSSQVLQRCFVAFTLRAALPRSNAVTHVSCIRLPSYWPSTTFFRFPRCPSVSAQASFGALKICHILYTRTNSSWRFLNRRSPGIGTISRGAAQFCTPPWWEKVVCPFMSEQLTSPKTGMETPVLVKGVRPDGSRFSSRIRYTHDRHICRTGRRTPST